MKQGLKIFLSCRGRFICYFCKCGGPQRRSVCCNFHCLSSPVLRVRERDVEDAEARLAAFTARLQESLTSGSMKLKLKQSQVALKSFMELNTFILNLRKVCSAFEGSPAGSTHICFLQFQYVTSEATRKILKKHAKRTALPLANYPMLVTPLNLVVPLISRRTGGHRSHQDGCGHSHLTWTEKARVSASPEAPHFPALTHI